jgi:NAD(P)-dependent dehydrogenase (short-subunit alcohol dehydrogenase family)
MSGGGALEDRNIIVTGASSGIGKAVAVRLAAEGARVACCGRNFEKLVSACGGLPGSGHSVYLFESDDFNGTEAMVAKIVEENGPLSGLVHCAGITSMYPLRDIEYDFIMKIFQINYFAFLALSKGACAKGRYIPSRMSIVGISSMEAIAPHASMAVYAASKASLNASITALAREFASRGVRFNSICPNFVDTPMIEPLKAMIGEDVFMNERVNKMMPLGLIRPEEVANSVVFLLSDASGKITGTSLIISSGGMNY